MNPTGLIIDGKVVPCPVPVYNWHDHGLQFGIGNGARKRVLHPDLIVQHWTGFEASNQRLYEVLVKRGLGIEFGLDRDGVIWQFADPIFTDTFDAGPYNPRSVGIENMSYGFVDKGGEVPAIAKDRPTEDTTLHGRPRHLACFYPKQIVAMNALQDTLCTALNIPKRVPKNPDGSVIARQMSAAELKAFSGVVGHFHLTDQKSDPGIDFFKQQIARGY